MRPRRAKQRRIWIAIVILFWLAVGLSLPFIMDFSGGDTQIDGGGVVAAPRDTYRITGSLLLDKSSSTNVSGGELAVASSSKEPLTAEQSARQLKNGDAVLLLSNGEIAIGGSGGAPRGDASQVPVVDALQSGRFKKLRIRNGTVIVMLPNDHPERLAQAHVSVVPSGNGRLEAKGEGFWRGQRAKFSLSTSVKGDGKVAVRLKFTATLVNLSFEGSLSLKGKGTVEGPARITLNDSEKLANALGTTWPISASVQNIHIEGPLRWQDHLLAFDQAQVRVGNNRAQGTVSLNTAKGRPLIASTLAFDRLDIATYLPSDTTSDWAVRFAWQWWSKLAGTLSQPAAPHINADIRMSAKVLTAGTHEIGPGAATVSLKDGRLSADIAEIAFDRGRATGQLSIDFNRYIPKLALRGRLEEIETGPWMETIAGDRRIEGEGHIVADLVSQGTSMQQILGDLKGRIELNVPRGGKVGISLAGISTGHVNDRNLAPQEAFTKALKGSTEVSNLKATFLIHDGVATIVNAIAEHQKGRVEANGRYDLGRSVYDFRMLSLPATKDAASSQSQSTDRVVKNGSARNKNSRPSPITAQFLTVKSKHRSGKANATTAIDVQVRELTGSLDELKRFLDPDYTKFPRRGL